MNRWVSLLLMTAFMAGDLAAAVPDLGTGVSQRAHGSYSRRKKSSARRHRIRRRKLRRRRRVHRLRRGRHRLVRRSVKSRSKRAVVVKSPRSARPVMPLLWRGVDKRSLALGRNGTPVPMEEFSDLATFMGSLPDDGEIRVRYGIYPGARTIPLSSRFDRERRNIRVVCWLHSIRFDTTADENERDLQLLIGSTEDTNTAVFMYAEIPGPAPWESERNTFEAVRRQLAVLIGADSLLPEYTVRVPVQVTIEGALFFDGARDAGRRYDPGRRRTQPLTVWELHPVTAIAFFDGDMATGLVR